MKIILHKICKYQWIESVTCITIFIVWIYFWHKMQICSQRGETERRNSELRDQSGEKKELVPERQVRNLWSRQIYTNTNFYTRIMSISEGESQTYCCSNQTSDFDIARDFCRKYGKELASAAPDVFNMLTWHQYRPFHGVILFYFKVFTPKC